MRRLPRSKLRSCVLLSCRSPIPAIPIPLLPEDGEPALDLNLVLHALMERARYDLVIDYRKPPEPSLGPEDDAWAKSLLTRMPDQSSDLSAGKENAP
jgi:hypothetical protein